MTDAPGIRTFSRPLIRIRLRQLRAVQRAELRAALGRAQTDA